MNRDTLARFEITSSLLGSAGGPDEWHGYEKVICGRPRLDIGSWIEVSGLKVKLVSGLKNGGNPDGSDLVYESEDGIKVVVPFSVSVNGLSENMGLLNRPLEAGDTVVDHCGFCAIVDEVREDGVFISNQSGSKFVSRSLITRIKPPKQ